MGSPVVTVGVDAGATLCKLVRVRGAEIDTALRPVDDVDGVRAQIAAWRPERLAATGGGADRFGDAFDGVPVSQVGEFAAWGAGAGLMAAREGVALPAEYLVASVGTGTSILAVTAAGAERAGGTALGGGTIMGLARLLVNCDEFDAVVALAAQGDRRRVDLLIGDLYRTAPLAVLHDLSASNFAKLASREPADLAHAIVGLVGENVALMAGALGRGSRLDTVLYCGATLRGNAPLRAVIEGITQVFGNRPLFLREGAFCGALGAAALAGA